MKKFETILEQRHEDFLESVSYLPIPKIRSLFFEKFNLPNDTANIIISCWYQKNGKDHQFVLSGMPLECVK